MRGTGDRLGETVGGARVGAGENQDVGALVAGIDGGADAGEASARETTCLPRVWPQRFGATWSSIITAAKPAPA